MKSLDVFMLSENSKWAIPATEALTKTSYLGVDPLVVKHVGIIPQEQQT